MNYFILNKGFRQIADSSWLIVRGLESWEAGMLEGSKACKLPGFLASQHPSLFAS
jgi:hypothetical protein